MRILSREVKKNGPNWKMLGLNLEFIFSTTTFPQTQDGAAAKGRLTNAIKTVMEQKKINPGFHCSPRARVKYPGAEAREGIF